MSNVLVVAAHPDDEVLGCGGTVARLIREGLDVFVAILGEGVTSRYEKREDARRECLQELHGKSREVAELLKVKDLFLFNFPDNRFDTIPLLDIVKKVEFLVEKVNPEIVYTHHGGDLNIDHVMTFRAVLTATRPLAGCPVKELYMFEVPSSTEWAFCRLETVFRPNMFVDISETFDLKLRSMGIYESEVMPFPHPRSERALRAISEKWGSTVGVRAAEAFETVFVIR